MFVPSDYPAEFAVLNQLIEEATRAELVRLNTYLRRYIAPQVAYELFLGKSLHRLLLTHQLENIVALTLDIRGFVRTTRAGETKEALGLSSVADWLQKILTRIIQIAFENQGLVGEFSGDRVMIVFGFPRLEEKSAQMDVEIRRAIQTALAIQDMVQEVKHDTAVDEVLRNFDLGIGVCAGGPAWIGNLDNEWRQELMVVSTAANIASRAEELTKKTDLMTSVPGKKIIVNQAIMDSFAEAVTEGRFKAGDLGVQEVRGLEGAYSLFHIQDVDLTLLAGDSSFKADHLSFVHWLSDYLDGALERDNSLKVRQALSQVSELVTSDQEGEFVYLQLMEQIINLFGAEKATLYRVDFKNRELIFEQSVGQDPPPRGFRLPMGTGIAGTVAETQQSVLIADLHEDPRWHRGIGEARNQRSMMCVPLVAQGVTLGLIQVIGNEPKAFSTSDLAALEAFAGPATTAIFNAQRYAQDSFDRRIKKIQLDITQALATLNLDQVLEMVLTQAIRQTLNPNSATLYLLKNTGELEFSKFFSKSGDMSKLVREPLAPGEGIAGMVAQTKKPYISADVHQDSDWLRGKDPVFLATIGQYTRSLVCVPMLVKQQVVGVIQVIDDQPGTFTQNHLEILNWLASSAAIAIDNAARYEELEEAHRKLKETQDRYVAAETMAGLGHIAGKLAHNLTNHVAAIRTNARHLLQERRDPKVVAEKILDLSDKAMTEIVSIREPLRTAAGERETNLRVLLEEIKEETTVALVNQKTIDRRLDVAIQLKLTSPQLLVQGGRDQVKYVFQNLVHNSIRAIERKETPEGCITIREVQASQPAGYVAIEVEDTGVGISEAGQKRVFELGYTDRPEGQVGGYGLFYVALTLQSLGGHVGLTSQEGMGTTFTVELPLAADNNQEG